MGIVFNQPQTITQLLQQKLNIPEYQRPYKWQAKHVNQLIDDIFNHCSGLMSYDEWGPEGVGYENILKHEAAMLKVLCNQ